MEIGFDSLLDNGPPTATAASGDCVSCDVCQSGCHTPGCDGSCYAGGCD